MSPDIRSIPSALFTLLGCELLGELLRGVLHLPIPGPVVGMLLLAATLGLSRGREDAADEPAAPTALDIVAGALLRHMGLLFVPAGVGIVAEAGLLRQEWLPILGGLLGSTLLSLAVTAFVMHRIVAPRPRRAALPPANSKGVLP